MTRPRKPRHSPSDAPERAAARSADRYARAAAVLPKMTLDQAHADALAAIMRRDGATKTAAVRAAIMRCSRMHEAAEILGALVEIGMSQRLPVGEVKQAMRSALRMYSAERASIGEFRQNFCEHVPGALPRAAQAMGISPAELCARMEAGQVGAADLMAAVAKGFGVRLTR